MQKWRFQLDGPEDSQGNLDRIRYFIEIKKRSGRVVLIQPKDNQGIAPTSLNIELENSSFYKLASSWFDVCMGFFEAFPLVSEVAHVVHVHKAETEVAAEIEKKAIQSKVLQDDADASDGDSYTIHEVSLQNLYEFNRSLRELNHFKRAETTFLRAQLLALIASYEAFIYDLLTTIIQTRPEVFISKEATVSAATALKATSIEDLRKSIIEERIESIQRESLVTQVKLIFERFKLPTPDTETIKEFGEICERRNIVTHANGVVNRTYTSHLKALGFTDKEIPTEGTTVEIDEKYIKRSVARVFQMGYFMLHILWQHIHPKESDLSVSTLVNHSHDFLSLGYTKMAERVCRFLLNPKSPTNEKDRAYSIINLALSFHLNDSIEVEDRKRRVEETLSLRDWSIVDPLFKLALCCLREDYANLKSCMESAIRDGLPVDPFLTWALFEKARTVPEFADVIETEFGIHISLGDGA